MPGCLLRPVVKKHYCLLLSSVLRSSIALGLILWLSVERKCASTATSVPFSLSIYFFFHRSVRHLRLLSFCYLIVHITRESFLAGCGHVGAGGKD